MDQAIHNEIVLFIRGVGTSLKSSLHFTLDRRVLSVGPQRSDPLQWR